MITKLNEWRKYAKNIAINEGGGAGVSFTTNTNIWYVGEISKDTFELTTKEITPDSAFSASGYEDGMDKIKSDLITWTGPELTRDMVLAITLYDGTTTLADELSKYNFITFKIEARYEYDNMHFGGWMRGTLKEGDMIFSQEFNRNKQLEVIDNNIEITGTMDDGENIIDEHHDNDTLFAKIAPIGTAVEDFTYFWQDVFNYDVTKDTDIYTNTIDDDLYDESIIEFMGKNDITMSLEDYKVSLENDKSVLPDDLYKYIQNEFEDHINDTHLDIIRSNYGA